MILFIYSLDKIKLNAIMLLSTLNRLISHICRKIVAKLINVHYGQRLGCHSLIYDLHQRFFSLIFSKDCSHLEESMLNQTQPCWTQLHWFLYKTSGFNNDNGTSQGMRLDKAIAGIVSLAFMFMELGTKKGNVSRIHWISHTCLK